MKDGEWLTGHDARAAEQDSQESGTTLAWGETIVEVHSSPSSPGLEDADIQHFFKQLVSPLHFPRGEPAPGVNTVICY